MLLALDENGNAVLPKKAERIWGNPGGHDHVGCYVDPRTGEVQTIAYRMPAPKSAKGRGAAPEAKPRPDVTQKGVAMIGVPASCAPTRCTRASRTGRSRTTRC